MEKTVEIGTNRRLDGTFGPGNIANPDGRPPDTEEKKLAKKVLKELVAEYKESLAEVLPTLSPILKDKALTGDIQAIKEVHDRVMGKPNQPLSGDANEPLIITWLQSQSHTNPETGQKNSTTQSEDGSSLSSTEELEKPQQS